MSTERLFYSLISSTCKCVLIFIFFHQNSVAQEQALLSLSLLDQNSQYISSSTVYVKDQQGNLISETVSKTGILSLGLPLNQNLVLEITAAGFKSHKRSLLLKESKESINIILEIENIETEVNVNTGVTDSAIQEALSKVWTIDEIAALPNDPNNIEGEIKRRYGDDVIIRVNGFTGGQLPPKEQIASIKVIKSSFDSEFHTVGRTVVDIRTKAGNSNFFGTVAFNFNDSKLNARNPLALNRLPEQNKLFVGYLTGPIKKSKTSFNTTLLINEVFETKAIIAKTLGEVTDKNTKSFSETIFAKGGIDYNLNDTHTLNLDYSLNRIVKSNQGVGELNLPETGFSFSDKLHQVRLFESGVINKKFVNEFKFEFVKDNLQTIPNNLSPSIIVLENFVSGGSGLNNQISFQRVNFVDNVFADFSNHFLKTGVDFRLERRRVLSKDGLNGSFIYTSINNFRNNRPAIFTQRRVASLNEISQTESAFYVQDDIRLYRNFQVGVGLRYELQNNLSDKNNFSPRLSFIFSPTKKGEISLKGGAGIFYQWFDSETLSTILGNDERSSDVIILDQTPLPASFKTIDKNLSNPSIFVTQIGVNHRVSKTLNIETIYKFQKGSRLFRSRNINAPIDGIRPNSSLGKISQLESSGNSTEHSLEIITEGRAKKFDFNLRYRLSKLVDDYNGIFGLPTDSYDTTKDLGFSNLDRRHAITGYINFRLLKKIQVLPIFRVYSPLPYTITTGFDANRDTVFNDRPVNVKRNSERGEWFRQFDIRLSSRMFFKSFASQTTAGTTTPTTNEDIIKSLKQSVEFSVTVQNIFNTTNLQNFIGNQTSPFFRQGTAAASARKIQLGINYIF